MTVDTDVLIIGGGLSGLRLGELLMEAGEDFQLVEARSRLGGRILSHHRGDAAYDLGPAWFWPGQPRMDTLVQRLDLRAFEQYATGAYRFEHADGRVEQGNGFAAMQGSLRIQGGLAALTDALAANLPASQVRTNKKIAHLAQNGETIVATAKSGAKITARRVIFALPPRLVREITFSPALPNASLRAMAEVRTWMAGQAKAILLYDAPFWRTMGLSGDAMSHRGPLVEIHDATPLAEGPAALFGFIGLAVQGRRDAAALRSAIAAQVTRLFGPDAPAPLEVVLQDWALEDETAVEADREAQTTHPSYHMPPALRDLWNRRLGFAGTEVARTFGGFLEGALEAAESAFHAHIASKERT